MVYKVIGVRSENSSEGLNILFTELIETGGKWSFEVIVADRVAYTNEWQERIKNAADVSVLQYHLLDASFGRYIGTQINKFISENGLEHRVHLICSAGHSIFQLPGQEITVQLGNGAYIAAETNLPVVSELLSLDIAFGGKAPSVMGIAEKLLPGSEIIPATYPEALVIALMGVLRWREEANMISALTGARKDSIGGALWLGTDA